MGMPAIAINLRLQFLEGFIICENTCLAKQNGALVAVLEPVIDRSFEESPSVVDVLSGNVACDRFLCHNFGGEAEVGCCLFEGQHVGKCGGHGGKALEQLIFILA